MVYNFIWSIKYLHNYIIINLHRCVFMKACNCECACQQYADYVHTSTRIGFDFKINARVCVCVRMGVNRKTDLKGTLLLEKGSFESTFVLAAAGCNTQNTTRRKHVTRKVKLGSEATNKSKIHLPISIKT